MEGKTMHEEETTTKPIDCDYCLVSIIFASCLQCSVMYFYTCHNLLHIKDWKRNWICGQAELTWIIHPWSPPHRKSAKLDEYSWQNQRIIVSSKQETKMKNSKNYFELVAWVSWLESFTYEDLLIEARVQNCTEL